MLAAISTSIESLAVYMDGTLAALVVVALIFGAFHGLSAEISRLVAFVVALAVASIVHGPITAQLFSDATRSSTVLSLAVTLIAAAAAGIVVFLIARRFLKILVGQPLDAVLGALFCAGTFCIILLAGFYVASAVPVEKFHKLVFEKSVSGALAAKVLDFLAL